MPEMALATFENNTWSTARMVPADSLQLHPAAHVLHYSSTCFEGLKAFRHKDDGIYIYRMDANVKRMAQSTELLQLPPIDQQQLADMIVDTVRKFKSEVPKPPGAMYIRPTHIGSEPSIGKAAGASTTSMLFVLLSPVGDYFKSGGHPLRVLVDEQGMRCAPHMGRVKSGGNYASALGPIVEARNDVGADQVLFCPDGDVQETGAANFILIDGNEIITKALDSSFLHGITRDSILTLAKDMGMIVTERSLTVDELMERVAKPGAEAALSGTAAVLTGVGTLIRNGVEYAVGNGEVGPVTVKLREALNNIQWGLAEDRHGWITPV